MIRVAITGPESSGKTILSVQLADHYKAHLVPEYAREFLSSLPRPYTLKDLDHIARQQLLNEELKKEDLIIMDTDLLVLYIWYKEKYGEIPDFITQQLTCNRYDLHLLMRPDIPYIPDPLRENPDTRDYFFELFEGELERLEWPYIIIEGNYEERFKKAKTAIDRLINSRSFQ